MPDIDVVDSTWISARPAVVAAIVGDAGNWKRWWPELDLVPVELRGDKGVRWTVHASSSGESGSMEVWLEPAHDGVVLHYFLRLDAAKGHQMTQRQRARLSGMHRRRAKQSFWALGDQLDPGRWARAAAARV
ncbi:MAG: polyketide cyclase / dehydrase and lipid transport [Jatrophihabitantaceae bacterium]